MITLFRNLWNRFLCKYSPHSFDTEAWGNENRGGVIRTCSRCGYWVKIEEYNRWNHPENARVIESGYTDAKQPHSVGDRPLV